jgi:hypothetical protein
MSGNYMAQYREKNKGRLQAYARKYYKAYRKGEKYSIKDRKGIAKKSITETISILNEYRDFEMDIDANSGLIPALFQLIKDLSTIADRFNELTAEEDFL